MTARTMRYPLGHFIECLGRGVELHCDLDDAVLPHEIVFAAQERYRTGRPVALRSLRWAGDSACGASSG